MKSNFDEQLTVSADGRTVTVSGPLKWEDSDRNGAKVTRIVATITQGDGTSETYAYGYSDSEYRPGNATWGPFEVKVDDDDPALSPGAALAGGVLFANGSGQTKWWPWPDAVELKHDRS